MANGDGGAVVEVERELNESQLSVMLPPSVRAVVTATAQAQGISDSALVRGLVLRWARERAA